MEFDPAAEETAGEFCLGVRVHHLGFAFGAGGEFAGPESVEEGFGGAETLVVGRRGRGGRRGGDDDGGDIGFEHIRDEFGVWSRARGVVLRRFRFGLDEGEGFGGDDDAGWETCDDEHVQ